MEEIFVQAKHKPPSRYFFPSQGKTFSLSTTSVPVGDTPRSTPVSRLGSGQAPLRQQLPCVSEWTSWFAGTQWGVACEAEPLQSFWEWKPQGSVEPVGVRRLYWVACFSLMGYLRCCNREVLGACWLVRVVAGRRWWPSCLKLVWGSMGSGSLAGGGLGVEDWWLWRTVCHSWIKCQSRCCSWPRTRALVPEHPPCQREEEAQTKSL